MYLPTLFLNLLTTLLSKLVSRHYYTPTNLCAPCLQAISKEEVRAVERKMTPSGPLILSGDGPRECYCHFTTATDTDNVRIVFEDVHNMIIKWNLEKIGVPVS